jgi:iron complex outermembrane recepter protein
MVFVMIAIALSPKPVLSADAMEEIPELQILKEEGESISRGLAQERPISQAPSNVYVITDEDIRESGAPDLPTILRRIPGIDVMQVTSAEYNVSMRGNNQLVANKLLVLIDGRSIYEDAYGTVFWTVLPVTLPEIKRIEVLKGPASAIYGFNAFDGVINIITKSSAEMKGTTVQVGGGELGTLRAAGIHAGGDGKFGYRLSVGRDQNQQWRNRDALGLRQNKVNAQTEYALSSVSKVMLQSGFVGNNRFDGQTFESIGENTTGISSGYVQGLYERPNFFIRAWWQYWNHENYETPFRTLERFFQINDRRGSIFQERERNTYNVDAQHTIEYLPGHRLTYGVNARHNYFASNFVIGNSAREDRVGFYLQEEWHPTTQFTAIAGLRYDLHSQINPTYSPRISFLYSPVQDHTFRISGAVAYRTPTLYETFIESYGRVFFLGCPPACGVNAQTTFFGSKLLHPEQIISYDAEYQGWYFKHRLRTRLALFYNQLSELITFNIPTPSNGRGKADIYGGEAGVEFLATKWLSGFANVTVQEVGQSLAFTAQRGMPRYKANVGVRADFDNGLNGEATMYYVGEATYPIAPFFLVAQSFPGGQPAPSQRVRSYTLLNLRVGYRFWHERAEVAVSALNALNDTHQEHPLGDVIGSQVLGWLTIRY